MGASRHHTPRSSHPAFLGALTVGVVLCAACGAASPVEQRVLARGPITPMPEQMTSDPRAVGVDRVRNQAVEGILRAAHVTALSVVLTHASSQAARGALFGSGRASTRPYDTVLYPPYSLANVIGIFKDCRGRRQHRGIDIAGVGENLGLGTPIYAMTDAEVLLVGRPEDDPHRYGRPDTRDGTTRRGKTEVPRSAEFEDYGKVYFFTRKAGAWKTGAIITTRVVGGPLEGYTVRYMHMGAIHPGIKEGDRIHAGQEIALMGGTAVQSSTPHVHIDIEDIDGRRMDVAPLLGLEADTRHKQCKRRRRRRR